MYAVERACKLCKMDRRPYLNTHKHFGQLHDADSLMKKKTEEEEEKKGTAHSAHKIIHC